MLKRELSKKPPAASIGLSLSLLKKKAWDEEAKGDIGRMEGQEMLVRYVKAESELEAKAMMQKEKPKDAYYPKFDKNV